MFSLNTKTIEIERVGDWQVLNQIENPPFEHTITLEKGIVFNSQGCNNDVISVCQNVWIMFEKRRLSFRLSSKK